MAITKADLPELRAERLPSGAYLEPKRPVLFCAHCAEEWSADPGDYWNLPDEHVFRCTRCCRAMRLVMRRTVREDYYE